MIVAETDFPRFVAGSPGWHFRDNKLKMFGPRCIEVVEGCAEDGCGGLRSWIKEENNPRWRGSWAVRLKVDLRISADCHPSFREDTLPFMAERRVLGRRLRKEAYLAWQATIPPTLQELVRPYRERHVALLRLAVRTGGAEGPGADLLRCSPGLAFAIPHAYYLTGGHFTWRRIVSILRHPQRQTIAALKIGRGTEAEARLLKKIAPWALTYSALADLVRAMQDVEASKLLAHVRCVNGSSTRLAASPELRQLISVPLLDEVGFRRREARFCPTVALLRDVLRMQTLLGRRCGRFKTVAQVRERHDEFVARLGGREVRDLLATQPDLAELPWPPPPLPGFVDESIPLRITPIDGGWQALMRHAAEMHHCAGGYAYEVAHSNGALYFYDVSTATERATLLIRKSLGNRYVRAQCHGPQNSAVSRALLKSIDCWLASAYDTEASKGKLE